MRINAGQGIFLSRLKAPTFGSLPRKRRTAGTPERRPQPLCSRADADKLATTVIFGVVCISQFGKLLRYRKYVLLAHSNRLYYFRVQSTNPVQFPVRLCLVTSSVIYGATDQFMNERAAPKIINFCVAKLSNSPAITCVPRLELDDFESQPDSPRINQRLLKIF
jgi:hypothetical protein